MALRASFDLNVACPEKYDGTEKSYAVFKPYWLNVHHVLMNPAYGWTQAEAYSFLLQKCEKFAYRAIEGVGIEHPEAYTTAIEMLQNSRVTTTSQLEQSFINYLWKQKKAVSLSDEKEFLIKLRNIQQIVKNRTLGGDHLAWFLMRNDLLQGFSDRMFKEYEKARERLYSPLDPMIYQDSIDFMVAEVEKYVHNQSHFVERKALEASKNKSNGSSGNGSPKQKVNKPAHAVQQQKAQPVYAVQQQKAQPVYIIEDHTDTVVAVAAGTPYKKKKAGGKGASKASEVKHGVVQDDCPFCVGKDGKMAHSHRYYRQCPRLKLDQADSLSDEKIKDIVGREKRCRMCLGTGHPVKDCQLPAKYDCPTCSKPQNRHFRVFCPNKPNKGPKGGGKSGKKVGTVTTVRVAAVTGRPVSMAATDRLQDERA